MYQCHGGFDLSVNENNFENRKKFILTSAHPFIDSAPADNRYADFTYLGTVKFFRPL